MCKMKNVITRSSTPLYPPKMLRAKERAPTLDYSDVFILDTHLSLSKNLGACHMLQATLRYQK
jgi:hypothetical protein